jgi:pimeloyl-ACP methyl ester carboxylesterase
MRRFLVVTLVLLAILTGGFLGVRDPDIPFETLVQTYAGEPSQFVELGDGLTAHYRDRGPRDAPVLLLVHGSNASLFTWEPWAEILEDRYRVISLDLLGHGLSSFTPGHDYSYAKQIRFLEDFTAFLGLEEFTLAGNSMGGGIAWHYALANPDQLSALVLLDASGIPRPSSPPGEANEDDDEALIYKIARTPILNQLLLHILPRSAVEAQLLDAVSVDEIVTEEMITRYHAFLLREGRRAATMARLNRPWGKSPVERLAEIKTPTLIMWGAEDTWVPVYGAHGFDEKIPNSTLILYDGVGHIPMEEVAEESARDLDAFLKALAPGPASE